MKMIMDYLRLILFMGAALVGVQVPSFVDLYGVQLNSRLQESNLSLSGFQNDADQYFDGDLERLVNYYQAKTDQIIVEGGNNIAVLLDRNTTLSRAFTEFNESFYSRYLHTFFSPINEIQKGTWSSYDYAVKLNTKGILWALAFGLLFSTMIEACLRLCGLVGRIVKGSSKAAPSSH